jgi:predicted metal-dependent hydrolase
MRPSEQGQLGLPFMSPASPGAAPQQPAGSTRRVLINGQVLDYTLRRSTRRSIGFMIDEHGLRVSAPKWVTLAAIESALHDKQRWIFSKLTQRHERSSQQQNSAREWSDGSRLPYLGSHLTLRLRVAAASAIRHDAAAAELHVSLPLGASGQQLQQDVQGWLQLAAKRLFAERLPHYANKLGVSYQSFALTSAKTQWGSCTAQRKIRLNWRLIHFPLALIDYVIAHELSHLHEMNHSPRFWATVQSIYPDHALARKTLREQARLLLPLL